MFKFRILHVSLTVSLNRLKLSLKRDVYTALLSRSCDASESYSLSVPICLLYAVTLHARPGAVF